MKTAVFAESMREQSAASPRKLSLCSRDSKSPGATLGSSNLPPGTNNLAAVERHRSRICSRNRFRKTPWFHPSTPPVRPGAYEFQIEGFPWVFDAWWDGKWTVRCIDSFGLCKGDRWRGCLKASLKASERP